ncbi:hypothetical protein NC652_013100 [Populus alba x Populus x berolinensis]|uniref:Uncharacterized protein n=1 Tax=Populus alba x Populus x berolinensis TaxID=444605 RepID=A0AAD6QTI6_9ROSI|nr:hypothetical protein NC652_013100 [Populus alba x Populus x berolinensis]KAJ6996342.1 hypothetical protein NC653_013060 [Populus alba x Populus x berolinensis]
MVEECDGVVADEMDDWVVLLALGMGMVETKTLNPTLCNHVEFLKRWALDGSPTVEGMKA